MTWLNNIEFADPEWLWALILIPILGIWKLVRAQTGEVRYSIAAPFGWSWASLRPVLSWLSLIAYGCWIVAFARPQSTKTSQQVQGGEGIDIILAVDVSPSMRAVDLKPNRLEALKKVANDFIDNRPNDRIGLVVYGGEAYTQTPLTTDHNIVVESLYSLQSNMLSDGTAVGMGLATAANRIKDSDAKSKVIILMTDGRNNTGTIDPRSAARLANGLGVKVYTIGMGTRGYAKMPVQVINGRTIYQNMPVQVDEELLKDIAESTNGKYFRATNNQQLSEIYAEIDQLEKSKIEEFKYTQYDEHFYPWAIAGLILISLEFLLRNTLFRSAL